MLKILHRLKDYLVLINDDLMQKYLGDLKQYLENSHIVKHMIKKQHAFAN